MRLAALLALIVSGTGLQGGGLTGGGVGGAGSITSTTVTLALYVDGALGNDGNSCTAAGVSACSTLQGAIDKIPRFVLDPVTVDIAAGSYKGFTLSERIFDAPDAGGGSGINIRGAVQAFGVATGKADGGVSSVATDAVGFSIVSDTSNAWTIDDLSSRFLSLTSGTGIGQTLPIISNTATAITVSGTFLPAPIAGTGYVVTTPSVLINAPVTLSPADPRNNASGSVGMRFSGLSLHRNAGTSVNVQDIGHDSGAFTFASCEVSAGGVTFSRIRHAVASQAILTVRDNSVAALVSSASGLGVGITMSGFRPNFLTLTNFYMLSTTVGLSASAGNSSPHFNIATSELATSSGTAAILYVSGNSGTQGYVRGSRLRCTAASSNLGANIIGVPQPGPVAIGTGHVSLQVAQSTIDTCGTGIQVQGAGWFMVDGINGASTFLSNTLGLNVNSGGHALFNTQVPTFTTNTTDISVDGATATRAAFVALAPNSISDLSYGSWVYLQP